MYSPNNEKSSTVLKLIRKWKGYTALVNLPYVKGVWIVRKTNKGQLEMLQWFRNNYEAVQAMQISGWHPDPAKVSFVTDLVLWAPEETKSKEILKLKFMTTIKVRMADLRKVGHEVGLTSFEMEYLTLFQEAIDKKIV